MKYSSRTKWLISGLIFLLPGLIGLIGDFLVRLPAINSQKSSDFIFVIFAISVLLAVLIPTRFIMSTPRTLLRRLAYTAVTLCLLVLEVLAVIAWSLRGIH
jgi:hypothetical protein